MDALKSILSNEHSLFGLLLIVAATVLTALGIMPVAQWTSYSQWIFGIYVGGHTAISVGSAFAGRPAAAPTVVAAAAKVALVLALAMLLGGCTWFQKAESTTPGKQIVSCIELNEAELAAEATQLRGQCTVNGQFDWACAGAQALGQGKIIAGCAVAELVQEYLGGTKATQTDESWKAHKALEDVRAKYAPGKSFRVKSGDRVIDL